MSPKPEIIIGVLASIFSTDLIFNTALAFCGVPLGLIPTFCEIADRLTSEEMVKLKIATDK